MPNDSAWLAVEDYPAVPTPKDLLEFFGIPPAPVDALEENIRTKRKHWHRKLNKARSDEAVKFAEAVAQAIDDAEDALLRGAATDHASGPSAFGETTGARAPQTVDDVWRELERLLFRGRYRDALHRVVEFEERWGAYPSFVDMRAMVILEVAQNDPAMIEPTMLESAIRGSRQVLDQLGPSEARYLTLVELLEVAGRPRDVAAVFDEAVQRIEAPSAAFRARRLAVTFRTQAWPTALRRCVELVEAADADDRALRSELVRMIVDRAVAELLPIQGDEDVARYREVVDTAAWIADGVPEAEAYVRAHRMWAANADQPVFGGNWQWRAFFALITGFAGLPLLNAAMAKPAWRVLIEGPALDPDKVGKIRAMARNRTWFLVTRNGYIQPVHEAVQLPWQQRPGQWADLDPGLLFNF